MTSEPRSAQVVLVTGPMGAGKSTLAANLAARLGCACLSEDEVWAGHDWSGLRTPEQEAVVQAEVVDRLLRICRSGGGAVLEFILYAEPPNPLTSYERALTDHGVPIQVLVLKPAAAEIMRRIEDRGRPGDLAHLTDRVRDVEHQLGVLDAPSMQSYLALDTTDLSIEQAAEACLLALGGPDSST